MGKACTASPSPPTTTTATDNTKPQQPQQQQINSVAIAHATLEHIVNKIGCFTLFVTHYPLLAQLEKAYPGLVGNYHMAFFEEEVTTNSDEYGYHKDKEKEKEKEKEDEAVNEEDQLRGALPKYVYHHFYYYPPQHPQPPTIPTTTANKIVLHFCISSRKDQLNEAMVSMSPVLLRYGPPPHPTPQPLTTHNRCPQVC